MKMIRLLWQEDPKGLTRTAIVRFLRHGPKKFYWNLPGWLKTMHKNNQITLMGYDSNDINLVLISFDNNLSLDILIN